MVTATALGGWAVVLHAVEGSMAAAPAAGGSVSVVQAKEG